MEIGESIAINIAKSSTDECPMAPHKEAKGFTQEKRPKQKSVPQLRSSMKSGRSTLRWEKQGEDYTEADSTGPQQPEPDKPSSPITIGGNEYDLSLAAHHLIPGKASLPGSGVAKYIWAKAGGEVESDAGYDVDGSENGLWMPTHQVMSSAMGTKKRSIFVHENEEDPPETEAFTWRQLSKKAREASGDSEATYAQLFLPRYTQQAMIAMRTQFHDSHSNYNTLVTKRLNMLEFAMQRRIGMCDECEKKGKPYSPAYRIVYHLNRISGQLRGRLTGAPTKKWLRTYTSDFSKRFASNPLPSNRLRGG